VRTRVAVAIGVVVLIIAALIGWRACGGDSKHGTSSAASNGTGAGGSNGAEGTKVAKAPRGPVKPASLSGRVVKKSDGTGIPGAVVSLARAALIQQILPTGEAALVVVTDAQGAWTISPVLPGSFFVAASAPGFLPGVKEKLLVASGDAQKDIVIALDAGGTIVSGTVTDVGGGPVENARVTAKSENDFDLAGTADLVAVTKSDGTYQLSLADGEWDLRAAHDEYTSAHANVELSGQPLKRDFVLTPGAVVRGTVVARDSGKPVAGAWIIADSSGGRGGGFDTSTRGDDQGNFVLKGLRPGALSVRAQGPGYASTQPTVVEIGIGEQVDNVQVLVDRAFTISGRVVRQGKPEEGIAGVQLGVFSLATQQFGAALEPTDASGEFVIHGVRPASYMLFAGGEGNVPELGTNVDVVDKDVTDVKVEMSAGVILSGRVDPPVAGARISLELTGQVGFANMFEAFKGAFVRGETNAQGEFTVTSAPPGAFTLTAAAPSGDTGKLMLVIGDKDQRDLVVKLEVRASIAGRLMDDKGSPVADAVVRADKQGDDNNFSMGRDRSNATTRADGSFKIVGLEDGKYSLTARQQGHSLKFKDGKRPKLELAKSQQLANLVVTVEARDGVIRGVVIGPDKRPVADAWVTAEKARPDFSKMKKEDFDKEEVRESWDDWDGPSKPVLTGGDGRFTITNLRRTGSYNLVADGPRGASRGELKDVKPGASVTISLAALGTLTGKVTADGKPATSYEIKCDGPDDDDDSDTINDPNGVYKLERMAPGKYKCSVRGAAGTGEGEVEVPPGPATLDIALEKWASVTGKVVDVLSKKPVAGMLVMTSSATSGAKEFEDMMRGRTPKTDANGVFVVERVKAGSGSVTINGPDLSFTGEPLAKKDFTATKGERVDVGTIEIVPPRVGEAGTFGFGTNVTDGKLMITSVKADGPAAAAGVRENDQIVALMGLPVSALGPDIAQKLVSSGTVGIGVPMKLTLDRQGTPVEVMLVSVKW